VQRRDKNAQTGPLLLGRSILYVLDLISLRRTVQKARREIGGIIIFDRYIYDQLAALPMQHWLTRVYAKALLRFAPKPDIGYVLDAEPEAARARKPEYPLEFLRRYRNSFLQLSRLAKLQLVPVGSAEDVHGAIIDRLSKFGSRFLKPIPSATTQAEVDSEVTA